VPLHTAVEEAGLGRVVAMPPDDPRDDEEEESRAFILARRAKFVAAALASAGLASTACDSIGPQPCLSPVAPPPPSATAPPPMVCLTPMMQPRDAGSGAAKPGKDRG
jgi:hypothetical protein